MARSPKTYRRIGAAGFSAMEYIRLYQAADHLLEVYSSGYTETYRRYFFQDIQAIFIEKTRWGNIASVVVSLTGLFFLMLALLNGAGWVAVGIIGGFFGLFLLINLIAGPTCAVFIQTAVQRQRLRPVTRLRTARRLLKRITPFIEQAQGTLSREELLDHLRGTRLMPVTAATVTSASVPVEAPPVIDAPHSQ
jgi:hypothetical protein